MRLAYADPPYPGMAGLYPESTEVDHVELVTRLCEYDGWALSTDTRSLAYVLNLCPAGTRVLAWCKTNGPVFQPNPVDSWEPVLLWPARVLPVTVRAHFSCGTANSKVPGLVGRKPPAFCEWIIRCLGAQERDTLDDIFPGSGVMGEAWERFIRQPNLLPVKANRSSWRVEMNKIRRSGAEPLDGFEIGHHEERTKHVDRGRGARGGMQR